MGLGKSKPVAEWQNYDPKHDFVMRIQYCGGWGYRRHATEIQREVEKMHPNQFCYFLAKDVGVTGNLEVSVGGNTGEKSDPKRRGDLKMVHSKRAG